MAHVLRMPAVLAGADSATLLTWSIDVGSAFSEGDVLAEVETDKAVVELTAEESAHLGRAIVIAGQSVAVGDPIAVLVHDDDTEQDIEDAIAAAGGTSEAGTGGEVNQQPVEAETARPVEAAAPAPDSNRPRGLVASPLVRRIARDRDIDLSAVGGTGPGGRIVRRDLEAWLARGPVPASTSAPAVATETRQSVPDVDRTNHEDVPHSGMRRAIARRLTESKTTVPHFYLSAELQVDELLTLRQRINQGDGLRVSVNDLLLKAAGVAFTQVPEANVIWTTEALRRFTTVDIAVAVTTDAGLVTPVIRDVASLPLTSVSAKVKDLVETARSGRLQQRDLEGGSFSITNLGMYGTREFAAIINPPHWGILAIGSARDSVVVRDGVVTVAKVLSVVLSVDHRAVDGARAAQWLEAFRTTVESPLTILI